MVVRTELVTAGNSTPKTSQPSGRHSVAAPLKISLPKNLVPLRSLPPLS